MPKSRRCSREQLRCIRFPCRFCKQNWLHLTSLSTKSWFLPNIPEQNLTVWSAWSEKSFVNRMPCNSAGFFLVSPERLKILFEIAQVEELQQMIARSCDKPVSVVVPFEIHNGWLVSVKRGHGLTAFRIPQLNRLLVVFTAGYNERLLWMPMNTFHVSSVPAHHSLLLTPEKIKNPQSSVVAARYKLRIRRTEAVRSWDGERKDCFGWEQSGWRAFICDTWFRDGRWKMLRDHKNARSLMHRWTALIFCLKKLSCQSNEPIKDLKFSFVKKISKSLFRNIFQIFYIQVDKLDDLWCYVIYCIFKNKILKSKSLFSKLYDHNFYHRNVHHNRRSNVLFISGIYETSCCRCVLENRKVAFIYQSELLIWAHEAWEGNGHGLQFLLYFIDKSKVCESTLFL